jgi:hypothetical protein
MACIRFSINPRKSELTSLLISCMLLLFLVGKYLVGSFHSVSIGLV